MEMQLSADLNAIIAMSDAFGRHRSLVFAYAELFGIVPLHAKAKKLRVILAAVKQLFDASGFSYQKRLYRISQEGIVEALNIVALRNFPDGLDSHNYLKKIMITIAEREGKAAGRQAEADLRTRERDAMSGRRSDTPYPVAEEQIRPAIKTMPQVGPLTDEQWEANRQRLKRLMEEKGLT